MERQFVQAGSGDGRGDPHEGQLPAAVVAAVESAREECGDAISHRRTENRSISG